MRRSALRSGPFGDFVVTHDVSVSPRNRQEVTGHNRRAEPPAMGEQVQSAAAVVVAEAQKKIDGALHSFWTSQAAVQLGVLHSPLCRCSNKTRGGSK